LAGTAPPQAPEHSDRAIFILVRAPLELGSVKFDML
jgi:hypothetical protein